MKPSDTKHPSMTTSIRAAAMLSAFVTLVAAAAQADETSVSLFKDLTAVIMLLGKPCDEVVAAQRQADNDHIATCRNGNRFHVYMNSDGRVLAEQQ